jgi:hypothetical protein
MTAHEIAIWFVLIFSADIAAIVAWESFQFFKNRRLDLGCDSCEEVCALRQTPDATAWLCPKCMKAFLTEHKDKFTEEQIRKSRKGYRRIKRHNKKKGD